MNILVLPNITHKKDLTKDSFVLVMNKVIQNLNKIRSDLYFFIPITAKTKLLEFDNVYQFETDYPSYPNSMRGHFDFNWWKANLLKWKDFSFDLIYSHLPEQTTQLINTISNTTNMGSIPILGYCHWTETREFAPYDETYLHYNILGVNKMVSCGYNTQTQINNILNEVKSFYSAETLTNLKRIMTPTYLGINDSDIVDKPKTKYENIIVFNHRLASYRKYEFFKEAISELRTQRQDFHIWASFGKTEHDYWIKPEANSVEDYYECLSKCCVGVLCGNRWAVSAQDGLMRGLPFIYEDGDETKELFGENLNDCAYKTKEEFIKLLNQFLDNKRFRQKQARLSIQRAKEMAWSKMIIPFSDQIDNAYDKLRSPGKKSTKKDELLEFVKSEKLLTKPQILKWLGWGVGIKFSPYRKYLLDNGVQSYIEAGLFRQDPTEYYTYGIQNKRQ